MKTGLEDYFIIKDQKKMRFGYTTGSCAAAAAKAAASMLFERKELPVVELLPPKESVSGWKCWTLAGKRIVCPVRSKRTAAMIRM